MNLIELVTFFSTGIQENMGQEQQQYELMFLVDKKEKLKYMLHQKAAEKLISKLRIESTRS